MKTDKAINFDELKDWRRRIARAFNPVVEYNRDPNIMLKSAYDARSEVLQYLNSRLCALQVPLPDGMDNSD